MEKTNENTGIESRVDANKALSLFDNEGFLICLNCHERLEANVQGAYDIEPRRIPVMCKCDRERREVLRAMERQREHRVLSERLRHKSLMDPEYENWTFQSDDRKYPAISDICRRYVDNWTEIAANNLGLLMYGGVGTGKSFYSGCIANALLDLCVSVVVTTIPKLISIIQSAGLGKEKNEVFKWLQEVDLLILDDLGTEKGSVYVLEQAFQIVDARYRAGKPLIVTTNLAPSDFKNPENLSYQRIYDRILQNCQRVKITGVSRRTEISAQKKEQFKNLLGL